jgi:hypothetical protein
MNLEIATKIENLQTKMKNNKFGIFFYIAFLASSITEIVIGTKINDLLDDTYIKVSTWFIMNGSFNLFIMIYSGILYTVFLKKSVKIPMYYNVPLLLLNLFQYVFILIGTYSIITEYIKNDSLDDYTYYKIQIVLLVVEYFIQMTCLKFVYFIPLDTIKEEKYMEIV